MIINTEWGAFDNERVVLKFTQYDNVVDRTSINPRRQAFEKSISGMYLGEVTRVVLLSLIDRELLFKGRSTPALNKHYGLDTELMSLIEAHPIDGSANDRASIQSIREVLVNKLGLADSLVTDADAIACHRVSEIVGTRGARLSACAVAATVQQAEVPKGKKTRFAVDGSVVAFYPGFEERLRDALKTLLGEQERDIEIGIAKDGSGAGGPSLLLDQTDPRSRTVRAHGEEAARVWVQAAGRPDQARPGERASRSVSIPRRRLM